jgi:hypothetical protein
MYFTVEENPNCEPVEGHVFQERTPARPVSHVLRTRQGREVWCRVTGLDRDLRERPAQAYKVDDSGEGTCYLVTGGLWGLRLQEAGSSDPWSLGNSKQWGEPFLLLPSDGADLKFVI